VAPRSWLRSGGGNGGSVQADPVHSANLALLGNYIATSFVPASAGYGSVFTEAPGTANQPPLLTHPPG